MSDASSLLELQDIDLAIMRAEKQLDELAEKQLIIDCRKKRNEICKKRAQVVDMADDVEISVERFQKEDETLREHLKASQEKLDATNDYRQTAAISKDMEGIVKRREKVEYELGQLSERSGKIDQAQAQIASALSRIDAREKELTASYREHGGALQAQIKSLNERRVVVTGMIDPKLLSEYERIRKAKGGIAAAHLEGRICSACHVEYQEGQLSRVRAEAPIATCPICNRLLIIDGGEGR